MIQIRDHLAFHAVYSVLFCTGKGNVVCRFFSHSHIFSVPFSRLFHNGKPFAKTALPQAHRVCGRRDQNLWQLPLLQPQWHALLSVCRGAWRLLCTEAEMFQSEQVRSSYKCKLAGFLSPLPRLCVCAVKLWLRPHWCIRGCVVSVSFVRNVCIYACHSLFTLVCTSSMCVVMVFCTGGGFSPRLQSAINYQTILRVARLY